MNRRWAVVVGTVGLAVAVWNLVLFRVPQFTQAVVVQLGDPVRTIRDPGLYARVPLVQKVIYFDKRLLDYDASPKELLTRDKQQLVVDNYVRYRIADPLLYYRTVRTEEGAQSRLDDIVYSNLRETLGRNTLRDVVSDRRGELMHEVTSRSDGKARELGIEVVDVRIKRADLPEKNEQSVFNRMRAERERLAKKFRAEGEEEARKIRSQADKEGQIILAEARQRAEGLRGQADAEAATIYAGSYALDPELWRLVRQLEAYRTALGDGATVVLSPDSEFFRTLQGFEGRQAGAPN